MKNICPVCGSKYRNDSGRYISEEILKTHLAMNEEISSHLFKTSFLNSSEEVVKCMDCGYFQSIDERKEVQLDTLKELIDMLEEDNQGSLAMLLRCVLKGRLDLLEDASEMVGRVMKESELKGKAYELYSYLYKELK